jgi:hypothetical protein
MAEEEAAPAFLDLASALWHEAGSSRMRFFELLREHFASDQVFRSAYLAYSEARLFNRIATICARRQRRAETVAAMAGDTQL